jgi:hypothetical protein
MNIETVQIKIREEADTIETAALKNFHLEIKPQTINNFESIN